MKKIALPLVLIVVGLIVFSAPAYALGDLSGACGKENAIRLSVYIPGITGVVKDYRALPFSVPYDCYYLTKFGSSAIGTLPDYIAGLYYFGVTIGGFVAAVMIMIGGVRWVMSGGSPDKISKAKEQMLNATVGLLLLLVSYTIFSIINPNLLRLQLPGGIKEVIGERRDLSSLSAMQKAATDINGWAIAAQREYNKLTPAALLELSKLATKLIVDSGRGVEAAAKRYTDARKTYGNDSPQVQALGQELEKLGALQKGFQEPLKTINQLSKCMSEDYSSRTIRGRAADYVLARSAESCLGGRWYIWHP